MIAQSYRIDPYGALLFFTTDVEEFNDSHLFLNEDVDNPFILPLSAAGISSDFKNGMVHLVGVFDSSIATLVHELAHVCIKILDAVNIPIDVKTSEAFTYLIGHLTELCLPLMNIKGDLK